MGEEIVSTAHFCAFRRVDRGQTHSGTDIHSGTPTVGQPQWDVGGTKKVPHGCVANLNCSTILGEYQIFPGVIAGPLLPIRITPLSFFAGE